MSEIDVLQKRILKLESLVVQQQEAFRNMFRTGTVQKYDGKKDRAVAIDDMEGDDDNGKPETPPIRVLGQSGKIKKRTTLSEGEQVLIISPGGDFGLGSFMMPLGYNEDNPSPSDEADEDITTNGSSTLRIGADSQSISGDKIDLGSNGGPAVARVGDMVLITAGSSAGLWPIVTGAEKTFAT